ncbi:X-linked lymphocyte-regulated protein 3A-like [Thomomys bottae]
MSSEKAQPMMPNDAQNPANNPAICSREAPGTMLDTEETEARIELENVLQKFQGDIEKLFLNKQKSMRKNVNASLTAIQKKLELVLKMQQKRRKRLYQESYRGLVSMCLSSKKDMKNFKKEEERMTVRFQKQEESFSACLSVQKCRLEGFEMLCEQYFKVCCMCLV